MQTSGSSSVSLSISIVLHNSPLLVLERTLDSLVRATAFARKADAVGQVSAVLVDNASEPHYRERLSKLMASRPTTGPVQLDLQFSAENSGFGAGHNSVISGIDSDYHLVLNPDVELHEEALLVGLTRLADSPEVALVSPHVMGGSGRREYLCKNYPSVLVLALRGIAPNFLQRCFQSRLDRYEMRNECSGENEVETVIASGCFMLARSRALRAIGGFDDGFFLYFEDFDLSLRLCSQGKLLYCPQMKIVHHGGYAAAKGPRHIGWFLRSAARFFHLHGWRWI